MNATQWNAAMQQLTNSGNEIAKLMLQDVVPTLPGAHVGTFPRLIAYGALLISP